MKKEFIEPTYEIIYMENNDIITASSLPGDTDPTNPLDDFLK